MTAKEQREERLAARLRDNLKRRKVAGRTADLAQEAGPAATKEPS